MGNELIDSTNNFEDFDVLKAKENIKRNFEFKNGVKLTKELIDEKIKDAELVQYALRKLVKQAYKHTSVDDWYEKGGPQLKGKGINTIKNALRISVRVNHPPEKTECFDPDGNPYVEYTYEGYSTFLGIENYEIGSANSKDKFVAFRNGSWLPLSQVNLTNVKKKALTNLYVRIIKRAAGLSHTWPEIEELTEFKITKELVKANDARKDGDYDFGTILAPHLLRARRQIRQWILEMSEREGDIARTYLQTKTSYYIDGYGRLAQGIDNTNDLLPKHIKYLYPIIQEDYKRYKDNLLLKKEQKKEEKPKEEKKKADVVIDAKEEKKQTVNKIKKIVNNIIDKDR